MSTSTKEQKHAEYLRHKDKYLLRAKEWTKNNPSKRKESLKKWNTKASEYKRDWAQKKFYDNLIERKYCERCGAVPDNIKNLVVHHIDGNNGKMGKKINNDLSNLIVVCRACHPKVHYRGEVREVLTK